MFKVGNSNVLAAGFSIAERTVSNVIIRSVSGTGGINVVFHNDLTGRVTGHRNHNKRASGFHTANGTVGNAIIGTLGDAISLNDIFLNRLTVGVSKRINDVADNFICTTVGAAIGRVTLSYTSGIGYNAIFNIDNMAGNLKSICFERNYVKSTHKRRTVEFAHKGYLDRSRSAVLLICAESNLK